MGASAAAAGVLVSCSTSNNNKSAATSAPTRAPGSAGTSAPSSTAAGAGPSRPASPAVGAVTTPGAAASGASIPPPPAYSKSPNQKLLTDYHWSKLGPQTQVLGTPRKGGVFVVGNPSFGLQSLHPGEEALGQWPFTVSHNGLTGMDFSYTHNPDLLPATPTGSVSESWEQPDAQTLIFKLRKDVTWQNIPPANGDPLTVKDIQDTYMFFKASKFQGLTFKDLERVEDAGNGSVKFVYSKPAAHVLGNLRNPALSVLNAKHIAEGDDALRSKAIGTGAFSVAKFQANTIRAYKRNPTYWEKDALGNQLPYLDGAVQTIISDKAAELAAFRSGQTDYYRPVSPEEFNRLKGELDVWAQAGPGCYCSSQVIIPSARDPLFKDVRVRRALSLAVDRQDIIDTVFGGAATPQGWLAWFFRGRVWPETYDEMGQWYKYDPQQAKQLLQAAGFQTPVTVDMVFAGQVSPGTNSASGDPYIEPVRRDLKAIGIELNLKPIDAVGITRAFFVPDWKGFYSYRVTGAGNVDADNSVQYLVTGSGLNGPGVSDPMLDDLFAKQRAATDVNSRFKALNDIEQYANRDQLLCGIQLPVGFGYSMWRKYGHNLLDPNGEWISGGGMKVTWSSWQEDKAAKRNIDSY
jgi:ABC-type transport system substrate-binding protein